MRYKSVILGAVAGVAMVATAASGQGGRGMSMGGGMMGMGGGMMGMGGAMKGMGHDSATMAQMGVIHQLAVNNGRITRTVTNLPDGIRTVTTSSDPALAKLIKDHVLTMGERVTRGDDPGLPIETPALRAIFLGRDGIVTTTDTTATGVIVVQTSRDSAVVAALQQHAVDVTDLVNRGMAAMHETMMQNMRRGSSSPDTL
jgi:hypothetical protein